MVHQAIHRYPHERLPWIVYIAYQLRIWTLKISRRTRPQFPVLDILISWLPLSSMSIVLSSPCHNLTSSNKMALERDREALLEVWGLYAVGTFSLFLRCVVRIRMLGLFGLQLEDAFAFVVLVCWTIICVSNPMMHDGTAMDFTPAETADFDWVHIRKLEHGSKVYLALWHVQ